MAVTAIDKTTSLKIKSYAGVDASGKAKYSTKNFSNINPDCSDAEVQAVGAAISELQNQPLDAVYRVDTIELVEE